MQIGPETRVLVTGPSLGAGLTHHRPYGSSPRLADPVLRRMLGRSVAPR